MHGSTHSPVHHTLQVGGDHVVRPVLAAHFEQRLSHVTRSNPDVHQAVYSPLAPGRAQQHSVAEGRLVLVVVQRTEAFAELQQDG